MTVKLYTKKGDAGKTSLFSGRRADKFDARVAAVGDLDELSASIGFARIGYPAASEVLRAAQRAIYSIGAILSAEDRKIERAFEASEVATLEKQIDQATEELPPLRDFIYPGDAEPSCRLHMARAIARRAERSVAALTDPAPPETVQAYLNRLSDLLFVLARQADHRQGRPDAVVAG